MKSIVATYLCALSFVSILPFCGGGIDRPSIKDLGLGEVTYQADDGVRIVASWAVPEGVATPPVVMLLHERDGTRAQWDESRLIGILVENGYAVLAPDLRGFGESNIVVRDGREEPYELTNSADTVLDVKAAIDWLKGQSEVDASRIGIVGSRLGADLAYTSTAAFPEVQAAVAISPDAFNPDDLDPLFAIPDFCAHHVFFMAGSRPAWEAAATLGVRVDHVGGDRYEDRSDLDGVALLTIDQPIKDILTWFETRVLATPAPTKPTPRACTPGQ